MALYAYEALSRTGKRVTGTLDASSLAAAKELILKQSLYPVTIVAAHKQAQTGSFFKDLFATRVSLKDKILFTKQLAVLLRSGVPILQAMELLIDQFNDPLRRMLIVLKDGLKEGQSLADGLKNYPKVFENIYVQLVRAGEASGQLENILDRLVYYLEREDLVRGKVRSAMREPLMNLSIIFLVTGFLVTNVVPKFETIFSSLGNKLPGITKGLLAVSSLVMNHYVVLIVLTITLIVSFLYWKRTPQGARTLDRFKLKIPFISFFARMGAVVQFCNTLGLLLESGVHLPEALGIVIDIVDNTNASGK